MNKIKKEDLMVLIQALEKINCQVLVKPEFEEEVYSWCQSQALDLGNYLEMAYLDTDVSPMVHELEEYCENIYLLSTISDMEDRKKIANDIQKSLGAIKNGVTEVLPD